METTIETYEHLDRDELIRLLRERDQTIPAAALEAANEPNNTVFEGVLSGGRPIVMRRLGVTQMDAIQVAVSDAYRDRPNQVQFHAVREQYMASLVQVGTLRLGPNTTPAELWESLGRNRSQAMNMWTLLHDTTTEEDKDFFGTIRPQRASSSTASRSPSRTGPSGMPSASPS